MDLSPSGVGEFAQDVVAGTDFSLCLHDVGFECEASVKCDSEVDGMLGV